MVKRNRSIFVPFILGILFSILYYILPLKYFVSILLGGTVFILISNSINLGLGLALLLLPFLPDMVNLLYMYFLLVLFIQDQITNKNRLFIENKIDIPIILYVGVIIFSTITSSNLEGSIRDLAIHFAGLSFLFVTVNNVNEKEILNKFFTLLVLSATIVSIYGLYQYVIGVEVDAAWVDVQNNPDVKTRIYSVFYNPNILAEYLIMTIPISIGLFWYNKKLGKKTVFLTTSLIMSLALVLTLSRGGWLGFAFSLFVFILLIEKKLLLSLIPIGILGVYLLPQSIINRILSIGNVADSSNAYRLKLWEITLKVIKDNWKAGVGFGHLPFKETFETYIRTMPTYHAHNTFLQTMAEIGIAGFIIFLFMLFIIIKYGIKILNKSDERYIRILGASLVAGLSGLLLHGLVENILYIPRIIIMFWIIISFILTMVKLEDKEGIEVKEN